MSTTIYEVTPENLCHWATRPCSRFQMPEGFVPREHVGCYVIARCLTDFNFGCGFVRIDGEVWDDAEIVCARCDYLLADDLERLSDDDCSIAADYEVWHIVPDLHSTRDYFAVEMCVRDVDDPNDVTLFSDGGFFQFPTYALAESFAIRNVCEEMQTVAIWHVQKFGGAFRDEPLRMFRYSRPNYGLPFSGGSAFLDKPSSEWEMPLRQGFLFGLNVVRSHE